ncbi:MAG: peptidylprolyl isomerase [Cellulosilyticaceae bacterium]
MNTSVLAKVNGKEITTQDLNVFIQTLGQNASQFASPEGQQKLIEELITRELFYFDAVENKLDQDEEFKKSIAIMQRNLLTQYAANKLLSSINVSDEDAKKYFDEHPDTFTSQPTVQARHILISTEEEATKILAEIQEGLSFEEAAKKYSSCPSKERGGDLGKFSRGQMVPSFEEAAFTMNVGEISKPVHTQFGYHLIEVLESNAATVPAFEEVKDKVKQFYTSVKTNELYTARRAELEKKYPVEILK